MVNGEHFQSHTVTLTLIKPRPMLNSSELFLHTMLCSNFAILRQSVLVLFTVAEKYFLAEKFSKSNKNFTLKKKICFAQNGLGRILNQKSEKSSKSYRDLDLDPTTPKVELVRDFFIYYIVLKF